MTALSQALVTIIGLIIASISLWGVFRPARLLTFVADVMARPAGIYIGVFVRLVLGAALIVCAPVSLYPSAFLVLGWVAVLAALGLAMMGRERVRALVAGFERLPPAWVSLLLLLGVLFGVFLAAGVLTPPRLN